MYNNTLLILHENINTDNIRFSNKVFILCLNKKSITVTPIERKRVRVRPKQSRPALEPNSPWQELSMSTISAQNKKLLDNQRHTAIEEAEFVDLIRQAQDNERISLEKIYKFCNDEITHHILQYLNYNVTIDTIDDITHNIFCELYQNINNYPIRTEINIEHFLSWIRRIAQIKLNDGLLSRRPYMHISKPHGNTYDCEQAVDPLIRSTRSWTVQRSRFSQWDHIDMQLQDDISFGEIFGTTRRCVLNELNQLQDTIKLQEE